MDGRSFFRDRLEISSLICDSTEVKMDDLPELPFEMIFCYLNLEDRLKARAVSRTWYHRINSLRVRCLCYSNRPRGFILGKRRLVSGAFAHYFISSTRFASFFTTFDQTILPNLRHLRLCDLRLNEENQTAFARSLSLFGQLQELDIIRFGYSPAHFNPKMEIELSLLTLHSIHLKGVHGIVKLVLDAPMLKNVKFLACFPMRVYLVHAEPVERLFVDRLDYAEVENLNNLNNVKKLKNLKYLHIHNYSSIDPTLPSHLEQLKELHLFNPDQRSKISQIFEQKQQLGLTDLKVYVRGVLLSGPDDPAILSLGDLTEGALLCLAENLSRLADEIAFQQNLHYAAIEPIAPPELAIDVLKKFTDLKEFNVTRPVQDAQRFLALLRNFNNIQTLSFKGDQPQELFDRLPEHSVIQRLTIEREPSDFRFLLRLKNLLYLELHCSIDAETVGKVFEELPYLSPFKFILNNELISIETDHSKRFRILVDGDLKEAADLNAVIEFISENTLL